ncbi:DUF4097 family beta strand repeat protein [Kineosporia sp. J2-2]|uniref:DUF4097 family beta strand repeat protein n=1 Tax=Kineosporia corallincola TaxID=2835133 RepID=A0ABS5TGU6_9ACTN|nr:DUF4097 family beta strand repeat-containing protein [Kineosporia corallincola]MBT0770093.1 DUF4097 family beta strand repeat protein [Kineosporia corallincola]
MNMQLRAVWLAAGAVATVIVLVSVGRVFAGAAVPAQHGEDDATLTHPVSKVVVDSNAGDATVTDGPDGQVTLSRRTTWSIGARPRVEQHWQGDVLHLDVRCPEGGVAGIDDCSADFEIQVPAGADVEAKTEAGTLSVTGVGGDVRLSSSAGDIELSGVGGSIHARTQKGSISGDDLNATSTDVEAQAGDAELSYASPPRRVRAVTSAGDVSVLVPSGAYAVVAHSDSQEATVGFTPDPDAEATITATVDAGSVEVGYRD